MAKIKAIPYLVIDEQYYTIGENISCIRYMQGEEEKELHNVILEEFGEISVFVWNGKRSIQIFVEDILEEEDE